jgi:hypothetical protein
MDFKKLKERFREHKKEDIIITKHAELQAFVRNINLEEVKNNIINPEKLIHTKQEESKKENEEKYDCYFVYSKYLYHRYILTINGKWDTHPSPVSGTLRTSSSLI